MLEWILAAIWAGYTPTAFFETEGDWQSTVVAAYRVNQQIEAVVASEQAKEAQSKSKKPKKPSR